MKPAHLIFLHNAVLDAPEMRCPKPCRMGTLCTYVSKDGTPCSFVHPGEQGVVRKIVPSHTFISPRDGKEIFMPARVKLFAEDGDPRSAPFAPYYTRLKLGLSWPDWCMREGLPMEKGVLPPWEAPKAIRISYILGLVTNEKELLYDTQEKRLDAMEELLCSPDYDVGLRDSFYQQVISKNPNRLPVPGGVSAAAAEESRKKQELGEQLYKIIQGILNTTLEDRKLVGLDHPSINPGKITGMLLEGYSNQELKGILSDDTNLSSLLMDACEVLMEAA